MGSTVAARVQAFDWLRGLAVLFMIQCHALGLLKDAHRKEPLHVTLVQLDGLVAPAFIFAAGFSLALVQCRAAAKGGARGPRLRRTLRRLGEVLAVATLVNVIWFNVWREPHYLWRLDILHCIGLSLLLALPVLFGLAGRPGTLRWVALALAALVFGVAPLFEKSAGPFDWALNQTTGALFPLLPWAGYVYLGASAGATAARGSLPGLVRWVGLLGALGFGLWWLRGPLQAAYPPHSFWVTNPANCGQRWGIVCLLVLGLMALERFVPRAAGWAPVRFLAVFGGSSMAAYFFHEMLLFKRLPVVGFSFKGVWGGSCDWPAYWGLLALLVAATFVLTVLTDRLYRRVDGWLQARATALS